MDPVKPRTEYAIRAEIRRLQERADAATSVKEIEALRAQLSRYLVILAEIHGANAAFGTNGRRAEREAEAV